MNPEELSARTCRWSVAVGEVIDALRQLRAVLNDLGVDDDDGSALVACLQITAERAEPPEITVIASDGDDRDDDDRGDPDDPDPEPPLPVVLTRTP